VTEPGLLLLDTDVSTRIQPLVQLADDLGDARLDGSVGDHVNGPAHRRLGSFVSAAPDMETALARA